MNSELKSERINDLAFVDDLQNLYDQMGKNIDRNVQSLEHNDKENTEPYLDQHLKLLGSGLKASANIQQSIWKEIQLVNKMGFQFNEMQNQLSRKAKGLVRLKQQMEELCSEEQLLNKKLGLLMSSDYKSKTILKKKILQYQKNLVESQDKISSLMLHLKESQDEIENVKKISQKLKFELDQKNEEIIALTKKTQWLQNRVNEENDIKKHRESEEESSKLLIKQIQLENSELKKKIEGLKIKMRGVNEVFKKRCIAVDRNLKNHYTQIVVTHKKIIDELNLQIKDSLERERKARNDDVIETMKSDWKATENSLKGKLEAQSTEILYRSEANDKLKKNIQVLRQELTEHKKFIAELKIASSKETQFSKQMSENILELKRQVREAELTRSQLLRKMEKNEVESEKKINTLKNSEENSKNLILSLKHKISSLNSHVEKSEEKLCRMEEKNKKVINELVDAEEKLEAVSKKYAQLETKLNEKVESSVKEKEKYLAEILELNEAIKRKDKKLVEEIHSFNALEREKKTLEEALAKNIDSKKNNFELMKKFNIKLEKYDFQIQELLKESKRKDQTYLELKSEFEENVTQLNGLKADYSRLHESKVDSERLIHKIKELEFERKDSIKTNQIQRDEIVKLSELIDKLKIELDDQKTVISNQSVRIKAKENWINPLKQEEQLQDLLKAKDIEIERVRISSLQDKNKMINDYSEKEERYQREIHQLKLQIHRDDSVVEKELEQYKNLLKIQSTEVERWREVHSQLKKENEQKDKQLEAILEKSSTKIKQLEESNQKMIDELKVIAEARTLEKESVSERERQLNYYAQSLDSEREKVRSKIDQFLNEMRASMSLNPLKNYLFVTEKEISKIQKALGKIPFGASNREPMEVGLEKLIDQRDELKNMIYESESIYQSKIKEFRQILNSGAFSDIPPLPPIV